MSDNQANKNLTARFHQSCQQPWKTYDGPIRMSPHSWYIGDAYVGQILFLTEEGFVLIDASTYGQMYMVFEAVRKMGFDPEKDIKLCLLTHAHLDHCNGMGLLQNYAHPVMYMNKEESAWVQEPEVYYAKHINDFIPFTPDRFYDYNETIELGGVKFKPVHTPGHSIGTTSIFFDDTDPDTGKQYKVGLHGGLGLNTLTDANFSNIEGAVAARKAFRKGLLMAREIPVDITLANHPENIDMANLVPIDTNDYSPFVDAQIWKKQIDKKIEELDHLEKESLFANSLYR